MPPGIDYLKYDYDYYITTARGISFETLDAQIHGLLHLSDDPEEAASTSEMQLQFAAYQEVLVQKLSPSD